MRNNPLYLLILFIVLVLAAGCESRAFRAEREIWKAHKLAEVVYKNPKGSPPYVLKKAQDAYRAIMQKYPDTMIAVQSEFSIGHLFLVKGQFDEARGVYKNLTTDCDKRGNLCAEAYYAIGKSYELQGRWDDALIIYRKIMQELPFSAKSLDLPLYIIRHYQKAKDESAVKRSVDHAVSYYLKLKTDERADKGAYVLQSLISRAYIEGGQWPEALGSLEKYARDYPDQKPEEAIFIKAMIYVKHLDDKARAKEELQRIVNDYPDSKLARQASSALQKF